MAQHERAVREAEEALRRANAPAPPAAPEPEMDGAAVIASLPAHERTQVSSCARKLTQCVSLAQGFSAGAS